MQKKVKKNKRKQQNSKWHKVGKAGLTAGVWLWDFLWSMAEFMPDPVEGRRDYLRRLDGWPNRLPRNRIYAEVKRMKDRGWIIVAEKEGKKFIKLTRKGALEILYRKLKSLPRNSKSGWDRTWWLALFDIPEKGRAERDAIRKALTVSGFYRLQKSVYVYPGEIPKELVAYLQEAKLLPYIRFVHVDKMDGTKEVNKFFKLR